LTYRALLAHGTELDATGVSKMIPGISAVDISAAMKTLEAGDVIGKANQLLVEFLGRIPLARYWGDGKSASSDMMSVATSRHLWNARLDPRRRTPSIGMYTHVHNQWPIIYNQPIVLGERQVGAAIEGIVRQTEIDIEALAVDTHGYSDVGMWVAASQGFDLCPRLRNLTERRLTLPKGARVPESLKSVIDATLHMDCATDQWDDLLRVAASINNGTVSAVLVLQRFGSAAQGDRLYRAAKMLGRLLRTIYLCDYFAKPEFRREIHRVLNRGESVHTLQRAIHFGEIPQERGRRAEEMIAISGSLSLLTNLVMGWTASKLQDSVATLATQGTVITPEVWRHISPARHAHVNFRGTFKFAFEEYGALWLEEGSGRAGRAGTG
jgi:TnpA family transposase